LQKQALTYGGYRLFNAKLKVNFFIARADWAGELDIVKFGGVLVKILLN
jgi:hypothetical protein